MHPACLPEDDLLEQCEICRQRRSGPGGQHRNKVETAVFVRHLPTAVEAQAVERRSQEQNRIQALFRLRLKLAVQFRHPLDNPDERSELWRSRSSQGRLAINSTHDDFPAILAEALDVLAHDQYDHKLAATRLQCSPSQLVKLLRKHAEAFHSVNTARQQQSLRPLR